LLLFPTIDVLILACSFQTKDGVAIFSVASRFNHACRKAVNLLYTIKNDGRIVIWAKKDIRKGTELSICYGGMPDQLLLSYGFRCACGGCVPLTDRQADAIKNMSRANWAEPNFDGIKETTSAQK
jgi:SET domain-containing protein